MGLSLSLGVVVSSTGTPANVTPVMASLIGVAGLSAWVAKMVPVPSSLIVPTPASLIPDTVVAVRVKVSLTSSGVS